jgi:hypothetical protein
MPTAALSFDPESRPSRLRALAHLPWMAYRLLRWRGLRGNWLPGHLRRRHRFQRRAFAADQPIDVIVLFSDHYEPAGRFGDAAAVEAVRSWCAHYEQLASPHRDSDGLPPQHTWFYRYDYPNLGCLRELSASAYRGFGEVEFHLHHGPDTHESFAAKLDAGLDWFSRFGALCTAEARPRQPFGYVAGNSALDNGAGDPRLSGCDTELSALREAGCYADFTFPALGTAAQPRTTNTIYYAREDGRPRSYDSGVPVAVGGQPSGDLMIFQGPVAFNWADGCVDDGTVEDTSPAHPRRLGSWLSAHVHVEGRPEWVFIKLCTHAMQNRASFLGGGTDATFSAMEHWWKRPPFRLHYVTAREAYNLVKAAEAGHAGDPNDYRDFCLPPPANRLLSCNVPWRLLSCTPDRLHVEVGVGQAPAPARLDLASHGLRRLSGQVREFEAHQERGQTVALRLEGQGPFEVALADRPTTSLPGPGWWSLAALAPGWQTGATQPSVTGSAVLDRKCRST